MKKSIVSAILAVFIITSTAFAWSVSNKIKYSGETVYVIKCDKGGKTKVKQLDSNGGWYVVGGSNHDYGSMESAVKVACKYAK